MKQRTSIIVVLAISTLLLTGITDFASSQITATRTSTDWAMYRHDLQGSGLSPSPAVNDSLLWKFFTGIPNSAPLDAAGRLHASASVSGGVVYVGSFNKEFYALDAVTGQPIWQVNVSENVESTAAVSDGVVYFGILCDDYAGHVVALNASNGSTIWNFATDSGIESSPAVVNGTVYIGSYIGDVYALNAQNGMLIWKYSTGTSTYSSPAVVDQVVYIGSQNGNIYALNANNGRLVWSFQTGSPVYASPAVVDNVVYVNADNGTVYALRATDGAELWQAYIGSGSDHADDSPAVAYGTVYVGSRNGYYALNATTGQQIWFFTSPYSDRQLIGYAYSSPAVAGNTVYFGSCDSNIFALEAFTGKLIWSHPTGGFLFASPAISNGALYIGSYDGNIYALGNYSVSKVVASLAAQPNPTASPTSTPQPSPTSNASTTAESTTAPVVAAAQLCGPIDLAMPTPDPSQAPAPLFTIQSPPLISNQPPTINWLLLSAILGVLLSFFAIVVLAFKKKSS